MAKINDRMPFTGYANNKQQTEKKKLYDVFVKGDKYFNSGDLLKVDHEGFIYFQDRIGDTFRCVNSSSVVLNVKGSSFVRSKMLLFGFWGKKKLGGKEKMWQQQRWLIICSWLTVSRRPMFMA